METIILNDKQINISKDTNNLTIKEFKKFFTTQNDVKLEDIDKQLIQMSILTNLSIDELENLDIDDYKLIAEKAYNVFNNKINTKLITTFKSYDKVYSINLKDNGDAKITIKDLSFIKSKIVNDTFLKDSIANPELHMINNLDVLAGILFKEVIDGKIVEDMSDDAIKSRAMIFNDEMTLEIIYPYIMRIIDKMK